METLSTRPRGDMDLPREPCSGTDTSLESLFSQFEERYRRETSDVRQLTCCMQEIVKTTEAVLDELEPRSFWRRIWCRLTGHTRRLQHQNHRNQLKLQHSSVLLVAAIARQNRMVMEGLQLMLEKLHHVEKDARYLKDVIGRMEERRERRRRRWRPVTGRLSRGWQWIRARTRTLFWKRGRSSIISQSLTP